MYWKRHLPNYRRRADTCVVRTLLYFLEKESKRIKGSSAIFNVLLTAVFLVAIFTDDISQKR